MTDGRRQVPHSSDGPESESSIEGYIDEMSVRRIDGWAWNKDHPERTLRIEARSHRGILASVEAHYPREDLVRAGLGTGLYGFALDLPTDTNLAEIEIWASSGTLAKRLHSASGVRLEGSVLTIDDRAIRGRLAVLSHPRESVRLEAWSSLGLLGDASLPALPTATSAAAREFEIPLALGGIDRPTRVVATVLRIATELDLSGVAPAAGGAEPQALKPSPSKIIPNAPDPRAEKARGFVDYLDGYFITGWAADMEHLDHPVTIEILVDGRLIARVVADNFRSDLADARIGRGEHGFTIDFDPGPGPHGPPIVRAILKNGGTMDLEVGSLERWGGWPDAPEIVVEEDEAPASPPPAASPAPAPAASAEPAKADFGSGQIEGAVDVISRSHASGWAWFPPLPSVNLRIEALLGDQVIGKGTANELRVDLAQHGKGTGMYGFRVIFDTLLTSDDVPKFRALLPFDRPLSAPETLPALSKEDAEQRPRGTAEQLARQHLFFTSPGPAHEDFDPTILEALERPEDKPFVFAFYLPQFHPIPENDKFWGKGFTEWRQLGRGMPRFPGHYQPRISSELGCYSLAKGSDTLFRQAELAKAAGVDAFAYYYYWFNRRRVLEGPLEDHLDGDIDMPLLLIWANENWTRTWDGSEADVLLRQDYLESDEEALVADLARHFKDPRYVHIDGRPLFILYNPANVPEPKETIGRWRQRLKDDHGLEPLMFMAQTFGQRDPEAFGLDGAMEFPPHKLSDKLPGRSTPDAFAPDYAGRVIDYGDFVDASLNEAPPAFPLIKTIVPSWDNDSRRPGRGLVLEGANPAAYQGWLEQLVANAYRNPVFGRPMVAVNAWNEWAEAAYLEPDVHYGSAYLNATARALVAAEQAQQQRTGGHKVTVILPNYNHEKFIAERIESILNQTVPPDEIIFLDDCSKDGSVEIAREILAKSGIDHQVIVNKRNSGGVFRQWLKGMALARNDLIWIAETDDSVEPRFLEKLLPMFDDREVLGAFGHISYIDEEGNRLGALEGYFDDLHDFDWSKRAKVPAYRAFAHDFAVKNVIPNASGFVFRKPHLSDAEIERLFEYKFAGDWYFYALLFRGGSIGYEPEARSLFRMVNSSASRSRFHSEQHFAEHKMILEDVAHLYSLPEETLAAHTAALLPFDEKRTEAELRAFLRPAASPSADLPLRIAIAAHSFSTGGGEVLPIELANRMKQDGHHVTYCVLNHETREDREIEHRLRSDIPVLALKNVDTIAGALAERGIEVFNSHNVSVDFHLYCQHEELRVPWIASLHGGYETVPDLMTDHFIAYLGRNVDSWLYLAEKNLDPLRQAGLHGDFRRSFNAVARYPGRWVDRHEFRREHGISDEAFVAVLCSRAIEDKGWGVAIDAFAALDAKQPGRYHLVLIGDGDYREEAERRAKWLDCVTFLGRQENPQRYFGCFDLGLLPSRFSGETFPLVMVECFQAGLPVVASDIGEIPAMMDAAEGCPGALVSHRSNPARMAQEVEAAVRSLSTDPVALKSARAAASSTAERYSLEKLSDLYADLSYELTGAGEERRRPTPTASRFLRLISGGAGR